MTMNIGGTEVFLLGAVGTLLGNSVAIGYDVGLFGNLLDVRLFYIRHIPYLKFLF